MRRSSPSAALIALSALLCVAAIPAFAQGASPPAQQNAAPAPEQQGGENRKSSATNDQSGPSSAAPTTSQQGQGDKATHSVSGRGGKEEPGSHAPSQDTAVFVNGALNVPGAPADSQTVPAKFSQRNAAIDKLPILGMSLGLSDEQKRKIVESVRAANVPVATSAAKVSDELAWNVTVNDLPASANDPALAKLKYVRLSDRVLLIEPTNRIVIGEIEN
jgi:hypothetical protein